LPHHSNQSLFTSCQEKKMNRSPCLVWLGSFALLSLGLVLPAHGQYRVQKSAFGNSGRNGFSQQGPGFAGQGGMQKMCGKGQGQTAFGQGGALQNFYGQGSGVQNPFGQGGGMMNPFGQGGGLQNPLMQGGGLQNPFMQGGGLQNPFMQGGGLQNPLLQGTGVNGPIDPAQLQLLIQMLQYQAALMQMQAAIQGGGPQPANGQWVQPR
jgi:hypothetical protein